MKKLGKVLLVVLIIVGALAVLWAIAPIQMTLFIGSSLATIYLIATKIIKVVAIIAVIIGAFWLIAKVITK